MTWKIAPHLAAAALLAAAAPVAAKSPVEAAESGTRQCFWASSVNGFASDDPRTVNVRVGVKDIYQFEMFGPCEDLDWNHSIALVSRGSSYICAGIDAEIISPSAIGPRRCAVRHIRKLTAEEIKALPKRARP
ncbi:DUF6491 family protein [uncultured Phenylobacterium sp.]|uniref:DUF6491 family protein n=1 Tax=uncultured Phenylobacterium sp. TaxID=349273 RepID=UPI0025E4BA94|nr:DUF6491 family protein [uncultured Phenylobacterium sp.]